MVLALHISVTLFLAMIFWGRWEHFYKHEKLTIRQNPRQGIAEIILTLVVAYMLYLMWAGK